ncbi:MAG: hypothetical protein JXB49_29485 [Bacteroidales bacterium]|nr:hypothetical protein [Bacteroidales bacterium]
MERDIEILRIDRCPICNESHSYNLKVKRTHIIKMLIPGEEREQPIARRYTRYFFCPSKQEKFQATITLYDTSWDRIEAVDIIDTKNE